jgi:hypothetical protein
MIKNYLTSEANGQKVANGYQLLRSKEEDFNHEKESKPGINCLCFV